MSRSRRRRRTSSKPTKFRDEAMAFAPSVTIKDYTYGGIGRLSQSQVGSHAGSVSDHHPEWFPSTTLAGL